MKNSSARAIIRHLIAILLFLFIGAVLFTALQKILRLKVNYPKDAQNISFQLETFFGQEKNTDDVLFLGTSHVQYGLDPMELYKEYGIVSYNLGTSAQRLSGTFFLLQEALKTQHPSVIVLDVSSLFLREMNETAWRFIMDALPSYHSKIPMAKEFSSFMARQGENGKGTTAAEEKRKRLTVFSDLLGIFAKESFRCALFPVIKYHTRWDELGKTDFRDFLPVTDYCTGGYLMCPSIGSGGITVKQMNKTQNMLVEKKEAILTEYVNDAVSQEITEDPLYQVIAPEENIKWLEKIQALCDSNEAQLLLIKIPSVHNPNYYPSAWTSLRSEYVKTYARDHGLQFFDMLYDTKTKWDTKMDSIDSGMHLNYTGAKKATNLLGDYLLKQYSLTSKICPSYEKNMPLYETVAEVVELEMEQDLTAYLHKLGSNPEDYIICFAAQNDMTDSLTEEELEAMHSLGLHVEFDEDSFRNAYVAVLDGKEIVYEAQSNRKLEYKTTLKNGIKLEMISAGWNVGSKASVLLNGREYACNSLGLNVVVLDKKTEKVIDSVVFNTYAEEHTCTHKDAFKNMNEYWMAMWRES